MLMCVPTTSISRFFLFAYCCDNEYLRDVFCRYAKLIEANINLVQQTISMLQAALSTGVGWIELWNHIKLVSSQASILNFEAKVN